MSDGNAVFDAIAHGSSGTRAANLTQRIMCSVADQPSCCMAANLNCTGCGEARELDDAQGGGKLARVSAIRCT